MNKALIAALAVLLVGGCSSMPVAHHDTIDRQYMADVENTAKRHGAQVVWINPPQKRPTARQ